MKYIEKYKNNSENIKNVKFDEIVNYLLSTKGVKNPQTFLNPTKDNLIDPIKLDNIISAANCIIKHAEDNSNIFIQVDSDTDGYCSAAIIYLYLKKINPSLAITWRVHNGKQHGILVNTVPLDTNLVIIPDAGSNQYDEHLELSSKGMDVIVLDHHKADYFSSNAIVVNNQLSDEYDNKDLSGAGVVYKLCEVLDMIRGTSDAIEFIDLAAVAIVGDMMQLVHPEIRYIVSYGLNSIHNYGLRCFIDKQSFSMGGKINPTTIAFYIVPLINALVRVGKQSEKEILFRALIDGQATTPSTKRGAKVGDVEIVGEQAARICANAKSRQQKTRDTAIANIIKKIEEQDYNKHKIIFVPIEDKEEFDNTLTGLVAMQICSKYKKPTVVARLCEEDGFYRGSARGLNNSPLKDLRQFFIDSQYFEYAQGHANAHGISIHEDRIENFLNYADEQLKDISFNENVYEVDFILNIEDTYVPQLIGEIGALSNIWGQGIEEPILVVENVIFKKGMAQTIGADKTTCKIEFNGVTFIKFKDQNFIDELNKYDMAYLSILGKANVNEWGGQMTPQIMIEDYQIIDNTYEF